MLIKLDKNRHDCILLLYIVSHVCVCVAAARDSENAATPAVSSVEEFTGVSISISAYVLFCVCKKHQLISAVSTSWPMIIQSCGLCPLL